MEPDRPILPPDADALSADAPHTRSRRSVLGWIGRIVGGLLLLILLVVGGLLLWLQTPTGAEKTLNYLADQFNPYEDATLNVESVSGNWLSNLSLYGLSLTRADGSSMAQIDSLELAYNLLAVPGGRLHLRDVVLSGALLDIREGAEGVRHRSAVSARYARRRHDPGRPDHPGRPRRTCAAHAPTSGSTRRRHRPTRR